MSELKHTPGPWKRDHLTIKDHRGMVVAQVEAPHRLLKGRERDEDMEWCKGNARLIAAAPELIELVKMVHRSFGGGNVITFSDRDIARFAEVFAKATGSQS
jgi:hypothetical protein